MSKRLLLTLLMLVSAAALHGCGQKGPLYLPAETNGQAASR
ncbi:MAG: lipoprotein [Xanthomonadaceae bacterium]|nr:lipoprotein [Xanthomonadaceae bacterium]